MKYLKIFNENSSDILIQIGDYIITHDDIYTKYIEENEVLIEDTSKIKFVKIQGIDDFRKEKDWYHSRLCLNRS